MPLMEDDARDFLKRIMWSISLGLFWLVTNIGIGAYSRLLVPEHGLTTGHILFYSWMVASLTALILINIRIWKKKFPHG